jgi:putative phosphoesterase
MKRIGLISDTHGYLDQQVFRHFEQCDEIWHAGDFGSLELAQQLASQKPSRGVYGNIDDNAMRNSYPEDLFFQCEQVKVFITHIGGYPPRYNSRVKPLIAENKPQLFICGHSHILKIMYDEKLECLHMNPGAAGNQGWHKVRTVITFAIDGKNIKDCNVIELGSRIKV